MSTEDALRKKIERLKKAQAEAEKLLEEKSRELYDLNQSLEEKILIRTREFEEAKNEAVAANKAKSQFLANMSHEIRTPLNGMIGFVEVLKRTSLDKNQMKYVKTIGSSGEMLLSIITDILEFSRIEAGHLDIIERPFGFRDSILGIVDVLAIKAFEKNLELPVYISSDIADNLVSDEGRIKQLIMNLLGNAIKFTHFGEVALRVGLREGDLFFEIIDTGIGIPEEKQKGIFDAFSQTDDSDTRKYGGTGLGLSICTKIVECMGGSIGLESEEGRGSRFYFSFPYNPVSVPERQVLSEKRRVAVICPNGTVLSNLGHRFRSWAADVKLYRQPSPSDLSEIHNYADSILIDADIFINDSNQILQRLLEWHDEGRRIAVLLKMGAELEPNLKSAGVLSIDKPTRSSALWNWLSPTFDEESMEESSSSGESERALNAKVLLVDDNLTNLVLLEALLSSEGISCATAENGKQAVKVFKENGPFELVLMDLQMPEMDGFQATREIHSLEEGKDVPVVAVTANAFRSVQEDCLSAGMVGYLTKPVSNEAVLEEVYKYISPESQRESNSRKKILLVEDNTINQELVKVILKAADYQCMVASNGEEGIRAFSADSSYDLILMDCQMPVMDGFDATRAIRRMDVGKQVPIVAMTANAFSSVKNDCLGAGMNDFLTKPILEKDLIRMVKHWTAKTK